MSKELIIRSSASGVDFALLQEGKLVELHKEDESNDFVVGNVMLAKIKKPSRGLNAAFVDIGYKKDGFLHYSDLGLRFNSMVKFVKAVTTGKTKDFSLKDFPLEDNIEKEGSIEDIIKANQSVLVQVVKEPISTKGPRLSCEIAIAGRYLVLMPFYDKVSISQKIEDNEEQKRLLNLIQSIKPKGFGVIIRTVAKDKKVADLDRDLTYLLKKWEDMFKKMYKVTPPAKVLSELSKALSIIRDFFDDEFSGIQIDDKDLYEEVREYISDIAPGKESIVKHYESSIPIFEKYGIERQIKTSFGRIVNMKKGASLVIEHTEALHVIDVNSGGQSNVAKTQQGTALEVNLVAAEEIAKQLRLRDMGGIIVIDFIDMSSGEDRQKLFEFFKEKMADDRAKHRILPPSKIGLIQMTRQRVRPERKITTIEEDPNNNISSVEAPILIIDRIANDLENIFAKGRHKNGVTINVHPFIAAYLSKGWACIQIRWCLKHKKIIRVMPRDAYKFLEYTIKDSKGKNLN